MLIIKTFLQRRKRKFPSEVNWTDRKECLLIYPLTIMFKVPKMCQKPKKLGLHSTLKEKRNLANALVVTDLLDHVVLILENMELEPK